MSPAEQVSMILTTYQTLGLDSKGDLKPAMAMKLTRLYGDASRVVEAIWKMPQDVQSPIGWLIATARRHRR